MLGLNISQNFTVDDIHAIREYRYTKRKGMTKEELKKESKDTLDWFNREMQKRKSKTN